MPAIVKEDKRRNKILLYLIFFILLITSFFFLFVNRIIEPILRQRLHTLIIQGSDSLYQYQLGKLDANFFGGNVEVENLHIKIDSSRYLQLYAAHALPALTMQLDLVKGQIKGIGLIALLFEKKITIEEIISKNADIVLLRHIKEEDAPENTQPLWKAIQPTIKSISIGKVNLDGVKLLYKNADTSEAVKLQFDKCIALFKDVKVDSASAADTTRIAFTRSIAMEFNDLKFRTPDSSYKMKAAVITYSSTAQTLELKAFKLQPTREEKEDFYAEAGKRKTMNVIEFDQFKLTRFRLDHFINNNIIAADTAYINHPVINIYSDKTYPPDVESKIGKYPHQLLLKAASTIIINVISIRKADLAYTEKSEKTMQEGTFSMNNMDIEIANVTNDSNHIKQNGKCIATIQGTLLKSSPVAAKFTFYLDSSNGRFDVSGTVKGATATQLNGLAEPLANTQLQSLNMRQMVFSIKGDDYSATSDVRMLYDDLFVVLRKTDEETGAVKTKKFLTKMLNKFSIYPANPGPAGVERIATNASRVRLSTQGFFGFVWKAIFAGMQNIMLKSGRYD